MCCVSAHTVMISKSDVGGTILKWLGESRINKLIWVVFSSDPDRASEASASAGKYLHNLINKEVIVLEYRDAFLNFHADEIKEYFESLKLKIDPDVVFTHFRQDRHQDHSLLSDLTYNTFRNHLILEYEIPKYDGDLGNPNTYVEIRSEDVSKKISYLLNFFNSQVGKHWFDEETFKALLRIRGLECNSNSRYAEAFYVRKCLIQ